MSGRLSDWLHALQRRRLSRRLRDPAFRFLLEAPPPDEWIALDCETTGLNVRTDEIISIAAVRIVGNRILTSECLELLIRPQGEMRPESICVHRLRNRDLDSGMSIEQAVHTLLHFIGSRPLVGYYLEFDVAMLNRVVMPMLGIGLPQPKIEVSALYYDHRFQQLPPYRQQGDPDLDLRFATVMKELDLPTWDAHDALNDAVMAGLAFVKLRHLGAA